MKSPCSNPCVSSYVDKSGITTICIRGYEPDTSHCKSQKTTFKGKRVIIFKYYT